MKEWPECEFVSSFVQVLTPGSLNLVHGGTLEFGVDKLP